MNSFASPVKENTCGGTGLLAIFCDLFENDQQNFRPWLVEDMFPARIGIGFNACASFDKISGKGQEFVTLYEMTSLGQLYGESYQELRRNRTPRDAAYHEKFQNPERYTLAWVGPEIGAPSGSFSKFICVDRMDITKENTQSFNIWFVGTYLPTLARIPGLSRIRRFLAMEGPRTHFVLHEFSELSLLNDSDWIRLRSEYVASEFGYYQRIVKAP